MYLLKILLLIKLLFFVNNKNFCLTEDLPIEKYRLSNQDKEKRIIVESRFTTKKNSLTIFGWFKIKKLKEANGGKYLTIKSFLGKKESDLINVYFKEKEIGIKININETENVIFQNKVDVEEKWTFLNLSINEKNKKIELELKNENFEVILKEHNIFRNNFKIENFLQFTYEEELNINNFDYFFEEILQKDFLSYFVNFKSSVISEKIKKFDDKFNLVSFDYKSDIFSSLTFYIFLKNIQQIKEVNILSQKNFIDIFFSYENGFFFLKIFFFSQKVLFKIENSKKMICNFALAFLLKRNFIQIILFYEKGIYFSQKIDNKNFKVPVKYEFLVNTDNFYLRGIKFISNFSDIFNAEFSKNCLKCFSEFNNDFFDKCSENLIFSDNKSDSVNKNKQGEKSEINEQKFDIENSNNLTWQTNSEKTFFQKIINFVNQKKKLEKNNKNDKDKIDNLENTNNYFNNLINLEIDQKKNELELKEVFNSELVDFSVFQGLGSFSLYCFVVTIFTGFFGLFFKNERMTDFKNDFFYQKFMQNLIIYFYFTFFQMYKLPFTKNQKYFFRELYKIVEIFKIGFGNIPAVINSNDLIQTNQVRNLQNNIGKKKILPFTLLNQSLILIIEMGFLVISLFFLVLKKIIKKNRRIKFMKNVFLYKILITSVIAFLIPKLFFSIYNIYNFNNRTALLVFSFVISLFDILIIFFIILKIFLSCKKSNQINFFNKNYLKIGFIVSGLNLQKISRFYLFIELIHFFAYTLNLIIPTNQFFTQIIIAFTFLLIYSFFVFIFIFPVKKFFRIEQIILHMFLLFIKMLLIFFHNSYKEDIVTPLYQVISIIFITLISFIIFWNFIILIVLFVMKIISFFKKKNFFNYEEVIKNEEDEEGSIPRVSSHFSSSYNTLNIAQNNSNSISNSIEEIDNTSDLFDLSKNVQNSQKSNPHNHKNIK